MDIKFLGGIKDVEFKHFGELLKELGLIRMYMMIAALSLLSIALILLVIFLLK